MKKAVSSIKGTKDILPEEVRLWQHLEKECKHVFELYGYREIRTPVFEATELFEKGTGMTSDVVIKEMYTFTDKGGRSITLRPEYTPSVVRAIIENRLYLRPEPLRFYFIGPMFRYDKPQKGRYRQFHQVDIEVFDEREPEVDAEIVEMAEYLLRKLGVRDIQILVNSVGCRECRPSYLKILKKKAAEVKKNLCPDCVRKVTTNPLRIFDCKKDACREAALSFPRITDHLCPECADHFKRFRAFLDAFGLDYKVDPKLVRGLDYYTKTTFEMVSRRLGAQDAVLGGGRYDDMMKEFGGPDICGIGFAMGVERVISLLSPVEEKDKKLYIACMGKAALAKGMNAAREIRRGDFECLLEYKERNLKTQLSRANKLGASWVLIIGEDELKKGVYGIKRMADGVQKEGNLKEILTFMDQS